MPITMAAVPTSAPHGGTGEPLQAWQETEPWAFIGMPGTNA
jgi:hypothetical protein